VEDQVAAAEVGLPVDLLAGLHPPLRTGESGNLRPKCSYTSLVRHEQSS
jgi:hypothetical protein